ncbi:MAG: hypothetical protein E7K44_11635 [Staphylococcus lugdunensis]|nr:hypothetical protein [Staphylococcus lugdunensis]
MNKNKLLNLDNAENDNLVQTNDKLLEETETYNEIEQPNKKSFWKRLFGD